MLVSLENVSGINLLLHIIQAAIITIRDDGLAHGFELGKVVHHQATEEGRAVLKGRLIDDHFRTFGLHTLHDALDGTLAEVVGVRFHRQTEHANGQVGFLALVIL